MTGAANSRTTGLLAGRGQGTILCFGNLVADILIRPVTEIRWGATTWLDEAELTVGGNGANTAYTLAKLGVPVRLQGAVGSDSLADSILKLLEGQGVDTKGVRRLDVKTALTVVLVRTDGERAFLHAPGASAAVDKTAFLLPHGAGVNYVHLHVANPFAVPALRRSLAEILEGARRAGLSTSLDAGWDSAGRWMEDLRQALPFTDIFFANELEAQMISGTKNPATAAQKLLDAGCYAVVIKLGRSGCWVQVGDTTWCVPAFEVPVRDTTGAGDAFVGGFLASLYRGKSWREAARFANAVGALSVQKVGATVGLLSYEETIKWMETYTCYRRG